MRSFGNGADRFGLVTRVLHWSTALLVLGTLPLGLYLAGAEIGLSTLWLFGLHKSIGIAVLGLALVRLVWHRLSPPPPPMASVPAWQVRAARWTHRVLYVLIVAMPVSGWVASSATGIDTVIFGGWTLPRIAPVSERWEEVGFAVHGALAAALLTLIALHMAGAVHRRDGTLRRMLRG